MGEREVRELLQLGLSPVLEAGFLEPERVLLTFTALAGVQGVGTEMGRVDVVVTGIYDCRLRLFVSATSKQAAVRIRRAGADFARIWHQPCLTGQVTDFPTIRLKLLAGDALRATLETAMGAGDIAETMVTAQQVF